MAAYEGGKSIAVRVGDEVFSLPKSRSNGHFFGTFDVEDEQLQSLKRVQSEQMLAPVPFQAVPSPEMQRRYDGFFYPIEPTGISVISDIDDTIKHSDVRNRKNLLANTFFHEFQPVKELPNIYATLADHGAAFHYVSSSPWQLFAPLQKFFHDEGFPLGPMHLRTMRWRGAHLHEWVSTSAQYKLRTINQILQHFPARRFVLVGDSGEKDPYIYAKLAAKYPLQIARICIRQVPPRNLELGSYRSLFQEVPKKKWLFFRDSSELTELLPLLEDSQAGVESNQLVAAI